MKLSGLVICLNEAARIERCLKSLAFCDEVIVVDGGSTDGTGDLARPLCSRLVVNPFQGVNAQKEFARTLAHGEWVLNLDADEEVGPELRDEILRAMEAPGRFAGFRIPVRTWFGGVEATWGGWKPNRRKRLFQREVGHWNAAFEPHDRVELAGSWGRLKNPLEHRPAAKAADLAERSLRYGAIAALALFSRGRRYVPGERWVRPFWRFVKSYILQAGFAAGRDGLTWAGLQRLEAFVKYDGLLRLQNGGAVPADPLRTLLQYYCARPAGGGTPRHE